MRLFIGLTLPAELQRALAELDPGMRGLRWLVPGQMHLTMSFLGEVPAEQVSALGAELAGVRVSPFFLPLQGLGSFSSKGKPTVVWAGVGRGHPHLFALHQHLQDAVLRAGLEPDLRAFHPHVTVARVKELSKQALQPFLRRHEDDEFGLFKVSAFTLYSSTLSPEGSVHQPEREVKF